MKFKNDLQNHVPHDFGETCESCLSRLDVHPWWYPFFAVKFCTWDNLLWDGMTGIQRYC